MSLDHFGLEFYSVSISTSIVTLNGTDISFNLVNYKIIGTTQTLLIEVIYFLYREGDYSTWIFHLL